jgi:hypothetical protein
MPWNREFAVRPVIPARNEKTGEQTYLYSLPALARVTGLDKQLVWRHRADLGVRHLRVGTRKGLPYFPFEKIIEGCIPLRLDPVAVGINLARFAGFDEGEAVDRVTEILWGDSIENLLARTRKSEEGGD